MVLVAGGSLVFDPGGWHSFGPVKWAVITTSAWLALALALPRGLPVHRRSVEGWSLLLIWAGFTSILALDPLSAWLGTPDRRMGMVALATMAAAFLAGQSVTGPARRRLLGRSAAVALVAMAIYGSAEALGWAPVELTTTSPRLGATFGSAAYLGAALCLLTPIAWGLAAGRAETRGWRVAGALGIAGSVFLLAGSATRAAQLGLAIGAIFVFARRWDGSRRRRLIGAVLLLGAAVIALSPAVRRLAGSEVEARWAEWTVAADALASRPLVGTGLEGYRITFPQHVDTQYVRTYGRVTVTDRAHSGPLDLGVAMGVPGAAAWILAAVWLTKRAWLAAGPPDPLLTGMSAGVVALLAQELFLFPTLEVGVAFWAVAGAVVASHPTTPPLRLHSVAASRLVLVVALAALAGGLADIAADHLSASARRHADAATAGLAGSLRPDSFRYPLLSADLALRTGRPGDALARVDEALHLSPNDPALRLARARVVSVLVAEGRWEPGRGSLTVGELVEDDPNHPELRLLHGDMLAAAGFGAEAERAFLAARHLSPRSATADLRLADLYLTMGEVDLAGTALERARSVEPDHPGLADLEEEMQDS